MTTAPKQLDLFAQRNPPLPGVRNVQRNPIIAKLALLSFVDLSPAEVAELDAELEQIGVRRAAP